MTHSMAGLLSNNKGQLRSILAFDKAALFLTAVLVSLILAPCSEARVLRMGIDAADFGTGDPHSAASRNDRAVVDMVFNGLLRYRPGEAPAIEPDLAVSIPDPRIEDTKQIWRFELRRDVMCHAGPRTEGYQLTADDVVFSLRRAADPGVSAYAGDYGGMTVSKVDEFTVDVAFITPISSILFFPKVANYAGGLIVCQKAVEAMGNQDFALHPVGTGPFVFQHYRPHEQVRLVANDHYFHGRPLLGGVEVHYIPELNRRDLLLRKSDLDVIFGSEEPHWFDAIRNDQSIIVDVFGAGQVVTIHLNATKVPLNDRRVRQAIAYAADRNVFASLFATGVAKNVYSPVPADFMPGGLTYEEVKKSGLDYAYDINRAKTLLEEAGFPKGFELKLVSSERDHYRLNYESLRSQLTAVGIDLQLEVVDHSEMHERIRQDENGIVIYVAWRPNADVFLTRFFHSDSSVVTGASPDTNFSHYDGIDRLIENARSSRDPTAQIRFWKQAQVKLLNDAVAYPLHHMNLVYARRNDVDYGHPLDGVMALYPQFTEKTRFRDRTVR